MDYISSFFYSPKVDTNYTNEQFNRDLFELLNFPENPTSQIKVLNNQLTRTDESNIKWLKGWKQGTTLDKTVDHIKEKIISFSHHLFMSHSKEITQHFKNPELFLEKITVLEQDLIRDYQILESLNKIKSVYSERYASAPNRLGLPELNDSIESLKQQIEEETNDFQKLIYEFNSMQESMDKKISLPTDEKWQSVSDTKSPQEDLASYCYQYNRHILPQEAMMWIAEGKDLLKDIYHGNVTKLDADLETANKQTAAIAWALMDAAIQKGEGFNQGSFIIDDPNGILFNLLDSHPARIERYSSHFAGRSPPIHKGIDIFDEPMPAGKRTLLFTQVKQMDGSYVLFLKPENYSADHTKKYDFMMHGWEYILAQRNKRFYPGSDDLPTMRKERVPVQSLEAFNKIVKALEESEFKSEHSALIENPLFEEPLKNAQLYGIAYMHAYLQALDALNVLPAEISIDTFYDTVKGLSDLDKRTGREAFIHTHQFL